MSVVSGMNITTSALALIAFLLLAPSTSLHAFAQPATGQKTEGAQEPQPIDLTLPIREGDVKIAGRGGSAKSVMVRVYSGWTTMEPTPATLQDAKLRIQQAPDPRQQRTIACQVDQPVATVGPTAVSNGAFEVTMPRRLSAGECVVVEDAEGKKNRVEPVSAVVQSVILDLGRLRGYFSIGGAISQSRSAFSQVDTFVGFTVDSRVVGWTIHKPCTGRYSEANPAPPECVEVEGGYRPVARALALRKFRIQLNTLAEARVGFRLATTGSAQGTGATTATGGQPVQAAFQRPDQLVFNSDQPGFFQAGVHIPISAAGMDWRNDGKLYSFYVGPVAKFGALSFDNPVIVSRTVAIDLAKPATDTSRYSIKAEEARRGAQPFHGYGIRMGIFGYDLLGQELLHRQIANDPVGYLDVTWGRGKGFRSYTFSRSVNTEGTVETVTIESDDRPRLMVEGRLKIPYLPALIGVDLNIRRGDDGDEEPNDFRFILAFRVDAQKALGRIFGNDALRQDR